MLKIHYLCGGKDNIIDKESDVVVVVICSKFITFAVAKTTPKEADEAEAGCDLLKIHYLCGGKDNAAPDLKFPAVVVICSKFITFAVAKTTQGEKSYPKKTL